MPRKKTVVRDTQVYKLPQYGATVTIDYDVANPPPFFQPGVGVVIVGEHLCMPISGLDADRGPGAMQSRSAPSRAPIPRGGNFEVAEDNPAFLAFKNRLDLDRVAVDEPAPPDFSPPVVTNDQINAEFEQRVKAQTGIDISVPNVATAMKLVGGG